MNPDIGHNPADKQLIDRILRGDHPAFGILVKNTENLVARIVFKMIPVVEDRKDLVQDIYLKTFQNLAGFKFQSKLSTWIARIAYNSCLSWLDRKKYILPGNLHEEETKTHSPETAYNTPFNSQAAETRIFRKELTGILNREIDALPTEYKMLITLFHQESMSYEEISQVTGLPGGTVKSSLFRARKMLKENLLSKYQKEAL